MTAWKWAVLLLAAFFILSFGVNFTRAWSRPIVQVPEPGMDVPATPQLQKAVFAGGCFWGVEAVFEDLRGVTGAVSGYAGGSASSARYDIVSGGGTQHAEAVEVTFDPAKITYAQLLKVFFAVAHDPTQRNAQGPDRGFQYRSAIFYTDDAQRQAAEAYVRTLEAAHTFSKPVVTQVAALPAFYPAEPYHQDYMRQHPYEPYIVVNDAPKLARLRTQFPELVKTAGKR